MRGDEDREKREVSESALYMMLLVTSVVPLAIGLLMALS